MKLLFKDSGIWQWAMFSFVLAGLAGFLYRLGFIVPLPYELSLENVRHAHSHLMFFGWAALLPLYLIKLDTIPGYHAAVGARLMKASLWMSVAFGLLSFPSFFLWGYSPVSIGSANIPISAVISGLVMLSWYGFMAGYLITRKYKRDFKPNIWFEGALVMLFVSSLGAWGVGFSEVLGIGGPLFGKALTHFFLAVFVEGWVLLVLIGLMAKSLKLDDEEFALSPCILVGLIAFGAPLTFPYGIPESFVDINMSVAARMGGVLIAEGLLLFVYSAFRSRGRSLGLWKWPLILLGLKALMQLIASLSPADLWLSDHGIRIFYLHTTLLGALTLGLAVFLGKEQSLPDSYFIGVMISVLLLLFSLIFLTGLWPVVLSGVWIYTALAIAATFPIIAMSVFWIKLRKS
ncbi:hypothetical protein [Gracilimonas tropica]|uniref:hypothetical protein n=1 Tax=Gracilimonas tropica TaxID=454600 RepID=UPI0003754234|nr:hypothetical protein [Gracilimonas tropica]